MGLNTHEILVAHYIKEIGGWNWGEILRGLNPPEDPSDPAEIRSSWIGTILGVYPSGKIYTFWSSNQTRSDLRRDEAFFEALEKVASEKGGWIDLYEDSIFFKMEGGQDGI